MGLSAKHKKFIDKYLETFNATEAYEQVYSPKTRAAAASAGHRLLRNVEISEAISERLQESAMSADEVLNRLAEHARADVGEYISDEGAIDIAAMKAAKATRLLRKVKSTKRIGTNKDGGTWENTTVEAELHNAQTALELIGKTHKLFTERVEHDITDKAADAAALIAAMRQGADEDLNE